MAGHMYASIMPPLKAVPPLMPVIPADTDWDTSIMGAGVNWDYIPQDRRHNGWAEVERRWACQDTESFYPTKTSEQSKMIRYNHHQEQQHYEVADSFPDPHLAILPPNLMSDFRMKVTLDPKSAASLGGADEFRKWTTFAEGAWSGNLGHGTVVGGGQDTQEIVCGKMLATQIEATHRLKTRDDPPAYIECTTRGFRTGAAAAASQDPRLCQYRVFISMKTTDERYAEKVNVGMWVGCCLWRGLDVVYE
ncbi:hypothetical protein F4809DRAFT_643144 [Biscogniauxia mediterranea]|nr:hypothetical protein F4809DRAFT_643144 [Biscogniauxia mediterranea]